jgi:hypothetical protein
VGCGCRLASYRINIHAKLRVRSVGPLMDRRAALAQADTGSLRWSRSHPVEAAEQARNRAAAIEAERKDIA